MIVVIIVDLRIKEWKEQQKLIEMIPIIFLTLSIQLGIIRIKDVLHTNCIGLRMTPNIGHITQLHGCMKKKHLEIKLDITKCMHGHMTLAPRY